MPKYRANVDRKVTVWINETIEFESKSLKAARKAIMDNDGSVGGDIIDSETLFDTEEQLTAKENGAPVVEIREIYKMPKKLANTQPN